MYLKKKEKKKEAYRGSLVDWFDDELLVVEGDVPDFTPGESYLWGELVLLLVHIQSKGVHAQPKFCPSLVPDLEIVDSIHLQILCDLEVFDHSVIPENNHRKTSHIHVHKLLVLYTVHIPLLYVN